MYDNYFTNKEFFENTEYYSMKPGLDFYAPPLMYRKGIPGLYTDCAYEYYNIKDIDLLKFQIFDLYHQESKSRFDMASICGFRDIDNNEEAQKEYNTSMSNIHYKYFNKYYYENLWMLLFDHMMGCWTNATADFGVCSYAYHLRYVFPTPSIDSDFVVNSYVIQKVISKIHQALGNYIIYSKVYCGDLDTFLPSIHFIISNLPYVTVKHKGNSRPLSEIIKYKIIDINDSINNSIYNKSETRNDIYYGGIKLQH